MIKQSEQATVQLKETDIFKFPNSDRQYFTADNLGFNPLIFYRNLTIDNISYFSLQLNEFLPKIKCIFSDSTSKLKSDKFALDDEILTVYLNSRNPQLSDIKMEFKIIHYNYAVDIDQFYIEGLINIDELYVEEQIAYRQLSSFDVIRNIQKKLKLGFASNIEATNDIMTWINPGLATSHFIQHITKSMYNSTNSFFWSYIDQFYNMVVVDVEKELNSDSRDSIGYINANNIKSDDNENIVIDIILYYGDLPQNGSNIQIKDYKIYNQSTNISIQEGYQKNIEFYDRTLNWNDGRAGGFVNNQIGTLNTTVVNDAYILKSDTSFLNTNIKYDYIGKLDIDNVHKNYNYAQILNQYNLKEIQKVYMEITLESPNYNLQRFQKIKVVIADIPTPDSSFAINKRLSGAWLITKMEFVYDNEQMNHKLTLIKRELTNTNFDI